MARPSDQVIHTCNEYVKDYYPDYYEDCASKSDALDNYDYNDYTDEDQLSPDVIISIGPVLDHCTGTLQLHTSKGDIQT